MKTVIAPVVTSAFLRGERRTRFALSGKRLECITYEQFPAELKDKVVFAIAAERCGSRNRE